METPSAYAVQGVFIDVSEESPVGMGTGGIWSWHTGRSVF